MDTQDKISQGSLLPDITKLEHAAEPSEELVSSNSDKYVGNSDSDNSDKYADNNNLDSDKYVDTDKYEYEEYADSDKYTEDSDSGELLVNSEGVIAYSYISPDIYTSAPCPEGQDTITISLYIYAIGHAYMEGITNVDSIHYNKDDDMQRPRFLPKYNINYPYLKIKAMASDTTLSFPKIEHSCITESIAGDIRFMNICVQALQKTIPEWSEYIESNPDLISSIYCGIVPNSDGTFFAVLNATELQKIPSPSMEWYLLDELIYSPDTWTPTPDIQTLFRTHPSLCSIFIQGRSGQMEIGPTPLCVYAVSLDENGKYIDVENTPPLLPDLHPKWGWVYSYTPSPISGDVKKGVRYVGFMIHVLYVLDTSVKEAEWEKASILYQQVDKRVIWQTRRPFSKVE